MMAIKIILRYMRILIHILLLINGMLMYLDPINNLLSPMFFNYDSFELVAIAFVASGIFIYNFSTGSTTLNNESLVNTLSNSDLSNNLPSTSQLIDVGVQTEVNIQVEASVQAATNYVNTGMQTSARMWLESISNWITEILGTNPNPQYVGVQTNTTSLWGSVKQWFLEVCSVRSSELSSLGQHKVEKWRTNLDSVQSVSLHNSESPLTNIGFGSPNNIQNLVGPDDSASNVSEVVSESALLNLNELPAVSDILNVAATNYVDTITDPTILAVWMNVSTIGV